MAQSLMDMLQEMTPPERLPSMLERTKADVAGFNANPRAYSEEQKMDIVSRAKQLGLDYSQGKNLDKATTSEKWTAGIGGALDAALFGILKDSWYSDQRTEKYANVGKLVGTAASFFIPAAGTIGVAGRLLGGAGKGSKAMLGVANALTKGNNAANAIGKASKYDDIVAAAIKAVKEAKAVHKAEESAESAKSLKQTLDTLRNTKKAIVPYVSNIGWKEALAAAREASKTATPAEYIKAVLRLQLAARASGNAGLEDTQRPYEDQMQMMQYLQQLQGYQQNVLGQ